MRLRKIKRSTLACIIVYFLSICCASAGIVMIFLGANRENDILVIRGSIAVLLGAIVVIFMLVRENYRRLKADIYFESESESES